MSIPFRRTEPLHVLRRCVARGFGLGLICALVGACSLLQENDAKPSVQPAGVSAQAEIVPAMAPATSRARPMRKPQPLTTPQPNGAKAAASLNPAGPDLVGHDLVGNDESSILASLGEPDARTRQGASQLWHYARTDCALDLLFFFDLASDRFRLALVRRGGAEIDPMELAACVNQAPADRAVS